MWKTVLIAVTVTAMLGAFGVGCKKAQKPAASDPHSADGIMAVLQQQGKLLEDALARQDYKYLHDHGYYFTGLLQAFYSKLEDAEKQKMNVQLEQLIKLSGQLDRSAGGARAEATAATIQKVQLALKDLEKQYREMKGGGG